MPLTNYTTFRVRGIPAGTTREGLQALIAEAVSCQDVSGIRIRSLAVDASRPREMVATFTFADVPEELSDGGGNWTVEAPPDITLAIDTNFHGWTTLYCPPADEWKSDLIAISGLNGHAFGSFKKKNSSYMWLCDSLPRDFPSCRIIIYGYDTKLQGSRSFQNLLDIGKKFQTAVRQVRQNARKLLIFLGHSLGGIVVKEAITLMRGSPIHADKLIFASIRGVIFFGVPNQGMDIRSLIPMVGDQANRGFLHSLDHDSPMLRIQAKDFSAAIGDIRCEILNFYETQESPTAHQSKDGTWSMSGSPAVLVDTYSATHGRPDDSQRHRVSPIDCDHSNLIKFGSAYDEPYVTVTAFLQEIDSNKASPKVPMTTTEEACYQSLGFREQYHRMDALEPAAGTCGWLTKHELFTEWLKNSKGFIWIRGKPGSGKSMAMKHALNHVRDSRGGVVASFFIHGQGTELQKTILGIYRSLLHQLYSYCPDSFSGLTTRFEEYIEQAGWATQDEKWSWMQGEIRQNFFQGLLKLCQKHRVIILVDALDESGEDQARAIFRDLETLIGLLGDGPTGCLSLCVACRHYPDIDFKNGKTIVMENFNSLDIKHVVNSRLDSEDIFEDSEKGHLKAEILGKSEGIFQWTSLVTEAVILMRQKGDSFQAAIGNLDRVPRDLDRLYKALLEPMDEHEHELQQRTKLFQWVALAIEPLEPMTLQHALALDPKMTYRLVREYEQSNSFIAEKDFETKIKNLSKGLIQIKGSFQAGWVEFIHQSIPDFLLKQGGLQLLSGLPGFDLIGLGHLELSMSCLKYLFIEEARHSFQTTLDDRLTWADTRLWKPSQFPVFPYAWRNWIFHAVSGKELASDRDGETFGADLIDTFCWPEELPTIEFWTRLNSQLGSPLTSWARTFRPSLPVDYLMHTAILEWPCRNARLIHLLAATGLLGENTQRKMSSDLESPATPSGSSFFTPLCYALLGQQKKTVQQMVTAGVRVGYATGVDEQSPLYLACLWGDPAVVSLLLRSGSNVGQRENNSVTPLHVAAYTGNDAVMEILIDAGANVNCRSICLQLERSAPSFVNGQSPLHLAAFNGHLDAVRRLIRHGADPNVKSLVTGAPPLCSAIQSGNIDTTKLLLQLQADIHARDSIGDSPIHYAIYLRKLNIIELLIELGGDVNAKNENGVTPLHMSVHAGSTEILDLLLTHGADPNSRTRSGHAPIHYAAEHSTEALQVLIHAGANVNVESCEPTPLGMGFPIHLAVCQYDPTRIQLLLQAGSNVNVVNRKGETPLRLAVEAYVLFPSVAVQLLLEAGTHPTIVRNEIYEPVRSLSITRLLALLLRAGMDPDVRDDEGETALFWVVRSRALSRREKEDEKLKAVKKLLVYGADPSITSPAGRTVLSYAIRNGDNRVAELLRKYGSPEGVWRRDSHFSFVRKRLDKLTGKSSRFFIRDRPWYPYVARRLDGRCWTYCSNVLHREIWRLKWYVAKLTPFWRWLQFWLRLLKLTLFTDLPVQLTETGGVAYDDVLRDVFQISLTLAVITILCTIALRGTGVSKDENI